MNMQRQHAGFLDAIGIDRVRGWVMDRATPFEPVELRVIVDGHMVTQVIANQHRPDVSSAGMAAERVGFSFILPRHLMDGQAHLLSFTDTHGAPLPLDDNETLGCLEWRFQFNPFAQLTTPELRFEGNLDRLAAEEVCGWAILQGSLLPCTLHMIVDGAPVCVSVVCNDPRPDVHDAGYARRDVGFSMQVPDQYHDDRPHELEFTTDDGQIVSLGDGSGDLRSRWTFRFPRSSYSGHVDGMGDGAICGWALAFNRQGGARTGGLDVMVSSAGQPIALLRADLFRQDVSKVFGCEPNCGFAFVPPASSAYGRVAKYKFTIVPAGVELEGSPLRAEFPSVGMQEKQQDLLTAVDAIFSQTWHLKQQIQALIAADSYNLHNYHAWATRYLALLKDRLGPQRFLALPEGKADLATLVSVICPTYRPRMADFIAAVESVRAQTHRNWELIIVDDCSDSAELAGVVAAFCTQDNRIRQIMLANNGGISNAINHGVAQANGEYVAFFNHDDLLVNGALETMLAHAQATGAQMLYCDEDKVDDAGVYSEVHFKPDWSPRLLLAQNYVCHLLFVRRDKLTEAGPLQSIYDGAHDHALILRLSEIISPKEVVHVPEILYHWRKTPTSTVSSDATKTFAVDAGRRAIADYLARRGITAGVEAPLKSTLYDVIWQFAEQPRVSIIIQYREQIEMTRLCVESLLACTDYRHYEIVLADNFLTSAEAAEFSAEFAASGRVRIIRVLESLNYSRINNIAAAATDSEFLVFLNNDVLVDQPDWLTILAAEAQADPRVGIVGAKLLYPNGTVQHGGVVLGVGGIADHAFRGLQRHEPGYMGRAICAHEVSAVTAACMLVRRSVFDEVGGFDEVDLQVTFNDVDLCLEVGNAGYRVILAPRVIAEYRESTSRSSDLPLVGATRFLHENQTMAARWKERLANDRFYSKWFSRRYGIYRDLSAPG